MTMNHSEVLASDVNAICFEVLNGARRIACTVSGEALEAASGLVVPSTTISRRHSFDRFRMVIHAAALRKLEELPSDFGGHLAVTSDDLRSMVTVMGQPALGKGRHIR